MQANDEDLSYNGTTTSSGNYFWAGAMSMAWSQLKKSFVKEDIKIATKNHRVKHMVENFNKSKFSKKDISPSSYYVNSGFGNETVKKINMEVKKKFPQKSMAPIKENLTDTDIIVYAYIFKMLQFETPFTKCPYSKNFGQLKNIKYFQAIKLPQKTQIKVHEYIDQDNFFVNVETSNKKQKVWFLKRQQELNIQSVLEILQKKMRPNPAPLTKIDKFEMPYIDLQVNRNYNELIGAQITNKKLEGYCFTEAYEGIKLKIDEIGVIFQNQGKLCVKGCRKAQEKQNPKLILLNKTFWIILRQQGRHPYLIAKIVNPIK